MTAHSDQPFDPDNDKRGPGVRVPPPVMVAGSVLLGMGLNLIVPLTLSTLVYWPGVLLMAVAVCLALVCVWQFWRAKTHIEPWQPTSRIIISGVYRFSRNPVYLAMFVFQVGLGLWLLNGWIVLCGSLTLRLLSYFAIRKEEAYLLAKFGDEYQSYMQQVRRWF